MFGLMALTTVLTVTLAAGASTTVSHGLTDGGVAVVPNKILAGKSTPIVASAVTSASITFTNPTDGTLTADFYVERTHSSQMDQANLSTIIWGGTDPSSITPQAGEPNTIMFGDLYDKSWSLIFPSNVVRSTPNYVTYTDPNGVDYADGVRINRQQNESAGDKMAAAFVAPPGCTSVILSMNMMLPAGITSQTVVIQIVAVDGVTVIQSKTCVLTSTMQTFSTPAATVVAGTEYRIVVQVHNTSIGTTANATAVVGASTLAPSGSLAAPFDAPWTRFALTPEKWHDNLLSSVVSRKMSTGPFSRLMFRTRASVIGLEYIRGYEFPVAAPAVYVDGRCVGFFTLTGSNALNIANFTLPGGSGILKTVEIVCGGGNNSATWPAAPVISPSTYMMALYVPRDSDTQIISPNSGNNARTLLLYGDSILLGFGCVNSARSGIPSVLRRSYPGRVIVEAHGSRSYAEDIGTAASPSLDSQTKRLTLVRKFTIARPSEIYMMMGTNDYGGGYWGSVATFSDSFRLLLYMMLSYMPTTRIFVQSPFARSVETANGQGWTLAQLRQQMSDDVTAIATENVRPAIAMTNPITFVDGSAIVTFTTAGVNSMFGDTIHLNENGCAAAAESIRASIGW